MTTSEPFPWATHDLIEEGRRLASERDDLITEGANPTELLVPVGPFVESPPPGIDDLIRDTSHRLTALERATIANALDNLSGDPGALAAFTRAVRDRVTEVVRSRADDRKAAHRPDVVEDRSDLRLELVGAADDSEVLERLASSFTEGAKVAKGIAGDLILELPQRGARPIRTVKVGDGHGSELSVNVSVPTEAYAELDTIVDILATAEIAGSGTEPWGDGPTTYAAGVRQGMAALLEVLASPKVKTTALDSIRTNLEGRGEDALAKRLKAAYGRRDRDVDPTVKIERKPLYAEENNLEDGES